MNASGLQSVLADRLSPPVETGLRSGASSARSPVNEPGPRLFMAAIRGVVGK